MNWWSRFVEDDWRYLRRTFFADFRQLIAEDRSTHHGSGESTGDVSRMNKKSTKFITNYASTNAKSNMFFLKAQSKTKIIDRPKKHHSTKNTFEVIENARNASAVVISRIKRGNRAAAVWVTGH